MNVGTFMCDFVLQCVKKKERAQTQSFPLCVYVNVSWLVVMLCLCVQSIYTRGVKLAARGPLAAHVTCGPYIDVKKHNAIWTFKLLFSLRGICLLVSAMLQLSWFWVSLSSI